MAGFSIAGYGQPLDFSGLAGALQQHRQRQDLAKQKMEADRKKQQIGVILQKSRDPKTGEINFQSAFQEVYQVDPATAYKLYEYGEKQSQMSAKGKTQGPAGQVVIDGKTGKAFLASRDPQDPTLTELTVKGQIEQPSFTQEGDMFPDENGNLVYRAPGTNTTVPVINKDTKEKVKDPDILKKQQDTKLAWADYGLSLKRENRAQQEFLGKISPKEKKQNAKVRVSQSLTGLKRFYDNLNSLGGIRNADNGSVKNLYATIKSSWLGQKVGAVAGTNEQLQREMIESTRPLLIQYIRQATEMGARGMDSEQELKFYLKAATDPKQMGYKSNINAINMLNEAYGTGSEIGKPKFDVNKVLNEFAPKHKEAPNTPVQINSDEEWEKLAPGTEFIGPDGVLRRK